MLTIENLHKQLFFIFISLMVVLLIFVADTLSISYKESLSYFNDSSIITKITNLSTYIFEQNNISLRFPFILFYAFCAILMYALTENYFKSQTDRLISTFLFMLLPGVLSASLLLNNAIIVIFCILLYLYYYKRYNTHNYFLLILFLFIDNSFAILYLALFFYSLKNRQNILLVVSLILFSLSMYIYGFDSGGKPRGHVLDTFAIYGSIFSPLIFLYYAYAMYRVGIKGTKSIYWYVSVTALLFSLVLSFRQRVLIEDFAPFVVVSLPIALKYFFHTIRVRLPRFRQRHYYFSIAAIFLLLISISIVLFNKALYLVISEPQKHFAYKYHFADDIAKHLHKHKINLITSDDYKLENRLKYYGIKEGNKYFITLSKPNNYDLQIPLKVLNKDIMYLYVLKTNNH